MDINSPPPAPLYVAERQIMCQSKCHFFVGIIMQQE